MASVLKNLSPFPVGVEDFINELSDVSDCWYNLGEFLLVPLEELEKIKAGHARNCLIEIYEYMRGTGNVPSWENITQAHKKMSHGDSLAATNRGIKPHKSGYENRGNNVRNFCTELLGL